MKPYEPYGGKWRRLTHEEEVRLAKRIAKGDEEARRIFIESNYPLVLRIAQRFHMLYPTVPFVDLVQGGCVGLIRAVDHYDWRYGTRFSTYAVPWIKQAVFRTLRTYMGVTFSLRTAEMVRKLIKERCYLSKLLGREPTVDELAERVGAVPSMVEELLFLLDHGVLSLEAFDDDDHHDFTTTYAEYLLRDDCCDPEGAVLSEEAKALVREAMGDLPKRLQDVLKWRFGFDGEECDYSKIGKRLGITRQGARQLVLSALKQLRNHPKLKQLIG